MQVEFTMPVRVEGLLREDPDKDIDEMSDEEIIEFALDVVHSAPLFDGINAEILEDLADAEVDWE